MKHVTIAIITLLSLTCRVHAQSATPANGNADAAYQSLEHTWELLPDGSTIYTYRHVLKYFTSYAFSRAYGESFIITDPRYQKLAISHSITTMKDGRKVAAPFNAFNEVLPGYAAGAAPYLHLREMVVTHTGLEAGSVVDFGYTITTTSGFMPGLSGKVLFGERSPIQSLVLKVIVPSGTPLRHGMLRGSIRPDVRKEGGKDVYTWSASDLPIVEVEATQPPMEDFLPMLYFSTSSYKDLAKHVLADANLLSVSPAMQAVANTATKDAPTPQARALALRSWVADHVARMSGPLDAIGFRPLAAQVTFDKRVGSDLDRAVLLTALCRSISLDADVILAAREHLADVPAAHLFSKAMVLCRDASFTNGKIFLDPGMAPSGPFASGLNRLAWLPMSAREPVPVVETSSSPTAVVATTSDWSLKSDLTLSGKTSVEMRGARSQAFDFSGMRKLIQKSLGAAGQGMKVTPGDVTLTTGGGTVCEADIATNKALDPAAGYARFALPAAPGGVTELHLVPADVNRTTPVQFPAPMTEECRMTLHLPGGITLVGGGGRHELSNAAGTVLSVIKADKHDIEVTRTITIANARIAPEHFNDLRSLLRAWQDPSHTTLLLRVDGEKVKR